MVDNDVPYVPWARPGPAHDVARRGRLYLGRSLREVCEEVGVSHETLRRWEGGGAPSRLAADNYEAWLKRYAGRMW